MLIGGDFGLEHGNGDLGLTRDILEQREYLADRHFTLVRLMGVVRPAEQNADEIWDGRVLAEDAIHGRVARRGVQGTQHLGPKSGTEANQALAVRRRARRGHLDWGNDGDQYGTRCDEKAKKVAH